MTERETDQYGRPLYGMDEIPPVTKDTLAMWQGLVVVAGPPGPHNSTTMHRHPVTGDDTCVAGWVRSGDWWLHCGFCRPAAPPVEVWREDEDGDLVWTSEGGYTVWLAGGTGTFKGTAPVEVQTRAWEALARLVAEGGAVAELRAALTDAADAVEGLCEAAGGPQWISAEAEVRRWRALADPLLDEAREGG